MSLLTSETANELLAKEISSRFFQKSLENINEGIQFWSLSLSHTFVKDVKIWQNLLWFIANCESTYSTEYISMTAYELGQKIQCNTDFYQSLMKSY